MASVQNNVAGSFPAMVDGAIGKIHISAAIILIATKVKTVSNKNLIYGITYRTFFFVAQLAFRTLKKKKKLKTQKLGW